MHMEHKRKDNEGKPEVVGGKPVPMPLCSLKILHGQA
jgi:hypothetical protein